MTTALLIAALVPALVLCIYLFRKDRVEKEPIGLLLKLLFFGAISCLPAIVGEEIFFSVIDAAFADAFRQNEAGQVYMTTKDFHKYQFALAFIGVALVEEFCKWILLVWGTKKNHISIQNCQLHILFPLIIPRLPPESQPCPHCRFLPPAR